MLNTLKNQNTHAEIVSLRHQLEDLVLQARHNERKLRRFQSLELRLIGLNSLYELIQAVLYPEYSIYKWDIITLLLFDPEYEVQRILDEEGVDLQQHPTLMFATNRGTLESLYQLYLFPVLGPCKNKGCATLFPLSRRQPASVALLPLVRHGKLIGSLNLGSDSAKRFIKGVRTDFFEHLAAIVAICFENATNLERLKRQGLVDCLTATNNRRFFDQRLHEEVESSKRSKNILSCLLLDIDHFKQVNDTYGHQMGDKTLRDVATLVRGHMRGSDVFSRYGGEEFAALLSGTSEEKAMEVAERIRTSIEQRCFDCNGKEFYVTISIGIATFDPGLGHGSKLMQGEDLIASADKALYEAKKNGRNRVVSCGNIFAKQAK